MSSFHHQKTSLFERFKAESLRLAGVFSLLFAFICLFMLLYQVGVQGWQYLSWQFLNGFPSRFPAQAGIKSAIYGTIWLMGFTALFSIPVGIMTGIYLEEYASQKSWVTKLIRVNIANLAGIPSIVYGLLGLAFFVRQIHLGRSILAGALTMSLLILPIVILTTIEALKAVQVSIRLAAYGVGATRRQVILYHLLPEAFPGIVTGIILGLSRAIGESAPLLLIGALSFVAFVPEGPLDGFTVLAIQIFDWVMRPQPAFHSLAAATIIVLLAFTLGMNSLAIWLRIKMNRGKQ